jgi:hypothetical protein
MERELFWAAAPLAPPSAAAAEVAAAGVGVILLPLCIFHS